MAFWLYSQKKKAKFHPSPHFDVCYNFHHWKPIATFAITTFLIACIQTFSFALARFTAPHIQIKVI
jgi:hypothetical protein